MSEKSLENVTLTDCNEVNTGRKNRVTYLMSICKWMAEQELQGIVNERILLIATK